MRRSRKRRQIRAGGLVALAVSMLVAVASCSVLGDSDQERAESDAIATAIQETLAQRPDVVRVKVGYQNNISNSASASVTAFLKPGADFDRFIDEAVRLLWLSKLSPLSGISVSVSDDADVHRGTTRYVAPADEDKAELEQKYGPRPPG
ncbi:hypothetical protein [Plantactinospora sp. KLBMP9567]|uniref:hypothetical protein n=1 Tax=Plantactinospora sp. KLBMP9567 TaxID=3085900 RepID=UPI002981D492|nr:hypothetical protein [Plantactinospora sp. KLBMP9567]MDW5330559.1 hypothetical protein [Plantactinospora sp. KLBMP9567]